MMNIVDVARLEFRSSIIDFPSDPYQLIQHVEECEKWARYLLCCEPEANSEIVLLAVWLHDIGHYPIPTDEDHAVRSAAHSEIILHKFNYDKVLTDQVIHCVRSHRCKDEMPETLEAKILTGADSASHMTDTVYFSIARADKASGSPLRALDKIQRDIDDVANFPKLASKLSKLSKAWYSVLEAYELLCLPEVDDE